jgi:hypothetical protein
MYAQIVPDTYICLKLLSFICPAERRDVPVLMAVKKKNIVCYSLTVTFFRFDRMQIPFRHVFVIYV